MFFSLFTTIAMLASSTLISAAPQYTTSTTSTTSTPKNFYLVLTTSQSCNKNSSKLANVSATSLFAPMHSSTFYLRTIEAGYLSLPQFNLTQTGTLTTYSSDGFGQGNYLYGNQAVQNGADFLLAQNGNGGGLSIKAGSGTGAGCLLQVNGTAKGWTICPGPLGQSVLSYKGTDSACVATYVQVVAKPPY